MLRLRLHPHPGPRSNLSRRGRGTFVSLPLPSTRERAVNTVLTSHTRHHDLVQILHRPPDLRGGAVLLHRAGRAGGDALAAHRPVPGDRPAGGHGARGLPGRLRPSRRADRRRTAGEPDQRRRRHDLHELELGLERRGGDPGHFRDRLGRRPRGAERQQPREAGRGAPARGGAPPGRHGGEGLVRVPAGVRVLFPGRALRRSLHQQLRHAERAGQLEARARHDQRADLRRQGLRHAHLAQARSPDAAQAHARRRGARHRRAERPVRGRQDRPDAHRRPAGAGVHHHHARADGRRLAVRRHHRARRPRRRDGAPARRGTRGAGLQGLRLHRPRQRQGGHPDGDLPAAGRQRAGGRGRMQQGDARAAAEVSRRPDLLHSLRHDPLRQGLHPRGRQDPGRGDGAGVRSGVRVPPELARHAHPIRRRAGIADRHLRRPVPDGLLHQHAHPVRHGAVDRHRGGRRHRRAGEHRAHHARGAQAAARGRDPGHERGDRTGGGDRADPVRGVRADRLPRRADRRAVPAVLGHHLHRGDHLRDRRAHAHTVAVRADPQAPASSAGPLLPVVQRLVPRRHDPLCQRRGLDAPARRPSG